MRKRGQDDNQDWIYLTNYEFLRQLVRVKNVLWHRGRIFLYTLWTYFCFALVYLFLFGVTCPIEAIGISVINPIVCWMKESNNSPSSPMSSVSKVAKWKKKIENKKRKASEQWKEMSTQFNFKYSRIVISETLSTWFPFHFDTPLRQYIAFGNFVKVCLLLQIKHFFIK